MGFDFRVEYRSGQLNKAADALSRRVDSNMALCAITQPRVLLLDSIRQELQQQGKVADLCAKVDSGQLGDEWAVRDGFLFYKGCLYLPSDSSLISTVLSSYHDSTHEGVQKTLHRLRADFYWKTMKTDIASYVAACPVCQQNKVQNLLPAGLLQPLQLPTQVWADVSMDFIEGLPKSWGKTVLLVVVDRFSKYGHFLPLAHPYTAARVAQVFFEHIVRLHGIPETITSDRDVIFTSLFWKELFRLSGTKLQFSTAYHPQTDGQTEVVNRTVEMYLRCFVGHAPTRWVSWVPWAEYCYNTSFHSALQSTPFKVVYGRDPPRLLSYVAGSSRVDAVDKALEDRDQALHLIRDKLRAAQHRMKLYYDKGHREVVFTPGTLVWLRLHPHRQHSLLPSERHKLSPKFFGPFPVVRRLGSVAYELQLPADSRLHNVFHVSLLKPFKGVSPTTAPTLPPIADGQVMFTPASVDRARLNRGSWEILVQWQGMAASDATWESVDHFRTAYPAFDLEDKLFLQAEGNVTDAFVGRTYTRKS